jgi:hypothetical protein
MNSLKQHCKNFHEAVFSKVSSANSATVSSMNDLNADFTPAGKLTLSEAFEVYADGYTARSTDALGEIFESVWRYCGDEDFFALVDQFVSKHPSEYRNLAQWGEKFPQFLAQLSLGEAVEELAKLDWARHEVFHEASRLQAIREMPTHFFETNFKILRSSIRIFDLWKAIQNDAGLDVELHESQIVLLFPKNDICYFFVITADVANFVEILAKLEGSLEEAVQKCFGVEESSTEEISSSEELPNKPDWRGPEAPQSILESQVQESLSSLRRIEWIREPL